ncbi:hypothetical protein [Streptomyces sp. NPDC055099]
MAAREYVVIADATQMDPCDLPGYAGRLFDYFVARPDHHRLITWGRLELPCTAAVADDPTQAVIARKIGQLREVQQAGQLAPAWDPADVLALVNQIAMTWAAQPELREAAVAHAVGPTTAARRAAVVTAVERLFPERAEVPQAGGSPARHSRTARPPFPLAQGHILLTNQHPWAGETDPDEPAGRGAPLAPACPANLLGQLGPALPRDAMGGCPWPAGNGSSAT